MGKAYTKGAKRRAKKLAGVADLIETPKREANGCFANRIRQQTDDPQKTALQARVRQSGGEDTREGRIAVSAPHMGCQMGLVMDHAITGNGKRDTITTLWRTFSDWCMAEAAYRRRYIGQSEYAKTASIQMMPERFEADASHTVDLRSEEEKDQAAINGYMHWQGLLGHLDRNMSAALHDARLERVTLFRGGKPTLRGIYALESLKALHLVVLSKNG